MELMYLRGQYFAGTHFLCKEDSFVKNNSNSLNSSQTCTSLSHKICSGGIITTIHIYIIPLTQENQTFLQKSRVILCLHYSQFHSTLFPFSSLEIVSSLSAKYNLYLSFFGQTRCKPALSVSHSGDVWLRKAGQHLITHLSMCTYTVTHTHP